MTWKVANVLLFGVCLLLFYGGVLKMYFQRREAVLGLRFDRVDVGIILVVFMIVLALGAALSGCTPLF